MISFFCVRTSYCYCYCYYYCYQLRIASFAAGLVIVIVIIIIIIINCETLLLWQDLLLLLLLLPLLLSLLLSLCYQLWYVSFCQDFRKLREKDATSRGVVVNSASKYQTFHLLFSFCTFSLFAFLYNKLDQKYHYFSTSIFVFYSQFPSGLTRSPELCSLWASRCSTLSTGWATSRRDTFLVSSSFHQFWQWFYKDLTIIYLSYFQADNSFHWSDHKLSGERHWG